MSRLHTLLDVACPDGFEVLNGPGINLAVDLHRVPDLAVFRAAPAVAGFITRPPVLAIEVASRSTRKRDRTAKKANYAAFGVDLYWIVEPDAGRPSLTAYELHGNTSCTARSTSRSRWSPGTNSSSRGARTP